MKFNKSIAIPIAVSLITFIVFKTVLLIGIVPSESMTPTLQVGDFVLCTRIPKDINKGDIVVTEKDKIQIIKRIAGVGGETIKVDDRKYKIPEGYVFLLGDNADNSDDSRFWKEPFVSEEQITAKYICTIVHLGGDKN